MNKILIFGLFLFLTISCFGDGLAIYYKSSEGLGVWTPRITLNGSPWQGWCAQNHDNPGSDPYLACHNRGINYNYYSGWSGDNRQIEIYSPDGKVLWASLTSDQPCGCNFGVTLEEDGRLTITGAQTCYPQGYCYIVNNKAE